MDADGTKDGYDMEMIEAVRKHVTVPVIASRRRRAAGATSRRPSPPGADAVLAASVFHFGDLRIAPGQGRPAGGGTPGPLSAGAPVRGSDRAALTP